MKETKSVQGFKDAQTPSTFFTCRIFCSKRKKTPFKNTSFKIQRYIIHRLFFCSTRTTCAFVPHAPHTFFVPYVPHILLFACVCLCISKQMFACALQNRHTHNQLCTPMYMYALHVMLCMLHHVCFTYVEKACFLVALFSTKEKNIFLTTLPLFKTRKAFLVNARKRFPCQTRRTARGLP